MRYLLIAVLGVVSLTVFITRRAPHAAAMPATVTANTPNLPADHAIRAEGRLVTYPGAQSAIGSEITGRVVDVLVKEQQTVHKGDVLVELDASEPRAALVEAQAKVKEAEAEGAAANADLARDKALADGRAISQQDVDHALRDAQAAEARRAAATATVARLSATLDKARIVAPIGGVITGRMVDPGEIVSPGTPLVTMADLHRTRIEAEVDEYDAGHIALGAPVEVTAEGFDGHTWRGRVEEIPDAVTGRRLKPQDPGKPSDTRVLLVKVVLLEPTPLKLGQRVEVAITPPSH